MSGRKVFPYYLFGIYIITLGKFFRGTFQNFKTHQNEDPLEAQVFFGAPRAAFKYYMEQFNGLIKLPMINYNISNMERKTEFERVTYMPSRADYNSETGKISTMRFPSVFEVTYSVQMWNNNLRERDVMMHHIINSFPMGDAWLLYYPDKEKYPDFYLPMPHTLDLTFTDDTDLETLEETETRDRILTSFQLTCTRAFVPYQVYEIPVISQIDFQSYINDYEFGDNIKNLDFEFKGQAQAVKSALIDIGLATAEVS